MKSRASIENDVCEKWQCDDVTYLTHLSIIYKKSWHLHSAIEHESFKLESSQIFLFHFCKKNWWFCTRIRISYFHEFVSTAWWQSCCFQKEHYIFLYVESKNLSIQPIIQFWNNNIKSINQTFCFFFSLLIFISSNQVFRSHQKSFFFMILLISTFSSFADTMYLVTAKTVMMTLTMM